MRLLRQLVPLLVVGAIFAAALFALAVMSGCATAERVEINPQIAAIALQVEEQSNAIAKIETTIQTTITSSIGANSGDNWTTRAVVVGATLSAVAWILVDRRRWHAKRKRLEKENG